MNIRPAQIASSSSVGHSIETTRCDTTPWRESRTAASADGQLRPCSHADQRTGANADDSGAAASAHAAGPVLRASLAEANPLSDCRRRSSISSSARGGEVGKGAVGVISDSRNPKWRRNRCQRLSCSVPCSPQCRPFYWSALRWQSRHLFC
jgi:hypothetical protein